MARPRVLIAGGFEARLAESAGGEYVTGYGRLGRAVPALREALAAGLAWTTAVVAAGSTRSGRVADTLIVLPCEGP